MNRITKEQLALNNIVLEDELLKTIPEGGLPLTEFAELDLPEENILRTLLNTIKPQQKRKLIYLWAARYIKRAECYIGIQPTIVAEALSVLKRLALNYHPRYHTLIKSFYYAQIQLFQGEEFGPPSSPENQIIQILVNAFQEDEHEAVHSTATACAKLTYTLQGTYYEDTYSVMVADVFELVINNLVINNTAEGLIQLRCLIKLLTPTQLRKLHDYYGRPIPLDKTEQACNDIVELIKTQNNKLEVLKEKIRKCFWIIIAITTTFMCIIILVSL